MAREGFGSIRQLPSKRWQVRIQKGATVETAGITFKTKAEARAYLAAYRHQVEEGTWRKSKSGEQLFGPFALRWFESHQASLKETTSVKYETNLRVHILPTFGNKPLNKIKSIDVNEWITTQIKSGLAPASIKYNHACLRMVMNEALRSELIERNPCQFTKLPRNNSKEPFILTIPEARAIMEAAPIRYYSFIGVLAFCGLRLGEAIALKVKHLDLENGQLRVEDTITMAGSKTIYGVTKTFQNRYVSIPSFLIDSLRDHVAEFTDGEADSYVFTSEGGKFIDGHNFRHRTWARTCTPLVASGQLREMPLIKDLRASCASWVAASSGIIEAAKRLGHSSTSTTVKHYARAIKGKDTEVARELDLSFLVYDEVALIDDGVVYGEAEAS